MDWTELPRLPDLAPVPMQQHPAYGRACAATGGRSALFGLGPPRQQGGGTSDAGTVSVDIHHGSTVFAHGRAANGIVAQSIGGGGGLGGDASGAPLSFKGTDTGGEGNGRAVTVSVDSSLVRTDGDRSFSIIAQSIGGGGGFGGSSGSAFIGSNRHSSSEGTSGAVTVGILEGAHVLANGEDSSAIFAQSDSRQVNGAVQVSIAGTVTGGSGAAGAGVIIAGGNSGNTLTVSEGGSLGAASGVAAVYRASDNTNGSGLAITNESRGRISGSIESHDFSGAVTGAAASAFSTAAAASGHPVSVTNRAGGVLTGAQVYRADLRNEGRLDVGNPGSAETLEIAGSFVQSESGTLHVAADFAGGTTDVLQIAGSATLGGTLVLEPLSVLYGAEMTVLTAGSGVAGAFERIDSELFTFAQTASAGGLALTVTGDRLADPSQSLADREKAVARYLSGIFRSGDAGSAAMMAALEAEASAGGYSEALSRLSPGASLAAEAASFELARSRFAAVLDCSGSAGAWSDGTRCMQVTVSGQSIEQDGSGGAFGYDGTVTTFGLSGTAELDADWRIGGAIGYETARYDGEDGYGRTEGESLYAGLSATRGFGPLTLAAAGVFSHGSFDTERHPGLTAGTGTARGDHDVTSAAARLRAEYRQDFGRAYLAPMLDLDMIWTRSEGYAETGAGDLSLEVDASEETAFVATPAIEMGHAFGLADGAALRLYGRAGVSLSSLGSYGTHARFADAGAGSGGFDSDVSMPDVVGRFSAGAEVMNSGNLSLDLRYDGAFGSGLTGHAGSLSVTYRF
ncbi:autotransporter outer membrane beta-barrel domain-containing protein [Mangrovicoccus ximenensis]|uniref:autotransporter outer membrane beta-barrel domain-containing protein n=1 Tax=Mangrovicoccus ximenensis TaxID=1911570 RepID=UPI0011AE3034|nr:autotransporter outer membrane beta-barrel domain-containing protein [Mangrovicoccus ximenensis]